MDEKRILDYIANNRGKIVGGLLGLALGIMLLEVGFFKTLLLVAIVVIGVYFGSKRENWDRFVRYLSRMFTDNRE